MRLIPSGEQYLDLQLARAGRIELSHGLGVQQGLGGLAPGLGQVSQRLQGDELQLLALGLGRVELQRLLGVFQGQLWLVPLQVDLGEGVVDRVGKGRQLSVRRVEAGV